ncbi:MAG TPA: peptidylprolyl isomerase [Terriglobales bacterium]|nr:peptidylprolyl isomerase [Terriglobales bacterium]
MIRFLQSSNRGAKILLGGMLLVLSAAMLVYLIPGFMDATSGPVQGVIASVGDEQITALEVQEAARRIGRQQFQRNIPAQLLPFFIQRAADSLVVDKAMLFEARRLGLKVSENEVRQSLRTGFLGAQLFPGGKFIGQPNYEAFVQQNFQMTVMQLEQALRNQLLAEKLRAVIVGGTSVSAKDIELEFQRQNRKIRFDYAVLRPEDVARNIHPAEAELRAFFQANQVRYANAIPEKRQVRYVQIDAALARQKVEITPQDLQRFYNDRRDQFRVSEQVDVRHILVKTPPAGADGKVDPAAVEAARKKAEDILKQLRAGADFAALAKKYSDDPGSKEEGGLYGGVTRGRMVPEFEKAAFSLPPGQISDLVQTQFGFHILKVESHQQAHVQTLEEVRDRIEPQVREEKASRAVDELASRLESEARGSNLNTAAGKLGFATVTTQFFSRTDTLPGIGFAPAFNEAVFNAREKAPPSIARMPQGYVVFELLGVQPGRAGTFEELRARVEEDFRNERSQQLLLQRTSELSDRARAAHDLKKAARELGAEVRTSELVNAQSQVPEIGLMSGSASVAFVLKAGEISGPIQAGRNGVVIAVLERQDPDPAVLERDKDQIRDRLLARKRDALMEVYVSTLVERLEKEGKIKRNNEELERLTGAFGNT